MIERSIDDQVAVVTGAGRGLGAAMRWHSREAVRSGDRCRERNPTRGGCRADQGDRTACRDRRRRPRYPEDTAKLAGAAGGGSQTRHRRQQRRADTMPAQLVNTSTKDCAKRSSSTSPTAQRAHRGRRPTHARSTPRRQHNNITLDEGPTGAAGSSSEGLQRRHYAQLHPVGGAGPVPADPG